MMLRVTALICGLAVVAQPSLFARATVLRQASVDELARAAQLIIYGVVARVDDDLAHGINGPFLTAVDLEVLQVIKGHAGETLRLVLPGGRAGDRTMVVPGMPMLRPGDEVVLLLEERGDGGYALAGLGQGVFKVERDGAHPPMAEQLVGSVLLVDARGVPVKHPGALAEPLGSLLTRLRHAAAGQPTGAPVRVTP